MNKRSPARQRLANFVTKQSGANVEVDLIGDRVSVDGAPEEVEKVAKWVRWLGKGITVKVETFADDPGWAFLNIDMGEIEAAQK